jgi:Transposase DDE domain
MAVMPSEGLPIDDSDLRGLKHLQRLLPLFARLHEVGCQRDSASNRTLHFDQYCTLVMLYLFNPLIDSVRCLQHASGLPRAKKLGLKRFSLGSFSEAPGVFGADGLKGIIAELAADARPLAQNPKLADLKHALTLADGTILEALPRLARAACAETRVRKLRDGRELHAFELHTQLDLRTFQPVRIERTGACNAGELRESAVLGHSLESGRCYVADAAYSTHELLKGIIDKGSSFVMRVREDCGHNVIEERALTPEARKAGITRDVLVTLGKTEPMEHPVRLITVEVPAHLRRTRTASRPHGGATGKAYKGHRVCNRLWIVTSLTDLPADLVALIYRQRYSVELFFRFFKHLLGMRHLLSRRPVGVDIQVHCAVIACLLINLQTGRKPDKRMMETIGWYLMGLMDEQQALDELSKPDNRGVKLRAKAELWKKLGV